MSISDWLESPEQFKRLLTALVSDKWEQLLDSLSMDDPVLRQFASTQWAQKSLPDEPDGLAVAALLIAYHFRCLLVDSLRAHNLMGNGLQEELNATLLMPLYIWPTYQIWVLQEFIPKPRVSQVEAIHWLLDAKQRGSCFMELEIAEPDSRLLTYLELKKNTTNLSRWIKDGFELLYHTVHLAVVQTPHGQERRPTVAELTSITDPEDGQDTHRYPQESGISRPNELSIFDGSTGSNKGGIGWIDSPILQLYLNWEEAAEIFLDLQRNSLAVPSLTQVARMIIDQRITSADLALHQKALAYELLSDLVDWIETEKIPEEGISLKNIEARWGQFHKSDISPLIKSLLEINLLQIMGQDGRVCITQPLIRDYLLSIAQVKRQRSTSPISPRRIALTTWIYWMVCHWLDARDRDHAVKTLWNVAGTFPGFNTGAWAQIGIILAHLPEDLIRDPHIRLLTSIVREVSQYNCNVLPGTRSLVSENEDFIKNMDFSADDHSSEFAQVVDDFRESLRRHHSSASLDHSNTLEIALGFDPSSRSDLWIRKHALSTLKTLNPEKEVEIRLMPFVYQSKKLSDVILDFLMKEDNWELRLAACESLVHWSVQEIKAILAEGRIIDLPDEYYYRSIILRGALEGRQDFGLWI